MPTKAAGGGEESLMERSWTDDLPVCSRSGVGYAPNLDYQFSGQHVQRNEYANTFLRTCDAKAGLYLYSVFAGHEGKKVADYSAQKLPAELLLGQINDDSSDLEIRETLKQAFESVEKGYFSFIDQDLAEKANIMGIIQGMNERDASEKFPEEIKRLKSINHGLASGASAIVALIRADRLFVANIGNCRALLCKTDANGGLRVIPIGVPHDVDNADEKFRLTQLGLNERSVRIFSHQTRCIGCYPRKGGYREIENLAAAQDEPVIADPEIYEMELNETSQFLVLLSDGAIQALEDALGTKKINGQIAQWIAMEFAQQASLNGVAQAVVDRIARTHYEAFLHHDTKNSLLCQFRPDITLIVRNLNYPLRTPIHAHPASEPANMFTGTVSDSEASFNTSSTDSAALTGRTEPLPLDSQGRIPAYVDFSGFYEAVRRAEAAQASQNE